MSSYPGGIVDSFGQFSENYNDDTKTFFTLGKWLCEANHCQTAGQMTLIKVDTHAQVDTNRFER